MITIPVVLTATLDGELLSPAQPIPADVIAIICDGENYNVYEVGDEVPAQ
jgi:hypothetical protein